jgi:hypothetical protein
VDLITNNIILSLKEVASIIELVFDGGEVDLFLKADLSIRP